MAACADRSVLSTPASLPFGLSSATLGTILCGTAAVLYALSTICLRQLADMPLDKALVIAVKETVTVVFALPWLTWQILRGQRVGTLGLVGLLIAVGLLTQIVGNLNQVRALGLVGLTVAVPVVFTGILVGTAVFSRIFLGEAMSRRSLAAVVLLIVSIALLTLGVSRGKATFPGADTLLPVASAEDLPTSGMSAEARSAMGLVMPSAVAPQDVVLDAEPTGRLGRGLLAALLAGVSFAVMGVAVRHSSKRGASTGLIMFLITFSGTVSMIVIGGRQAGLAPLWGASFDLWAWMLASGVFNCAAFLCLTVGLSMTKAVRANVLNASQVAITAIVGIVFFHEPWGLVLLAGIVLTIIGITLITSPDTDEVEPGL